MKVHEYMNKILSGNVEIVSKRELQCNIKEAGVYQNQTKQLLIQIFYKIISECLKRENIFTN